MNFTAIDFETSNQHRTSACQIGIVVVENGMIVKEFSSYILPEPFYFLSHFTSDIHGIDKKTVINAPTFFELWSDISELIANAHVLVAHNASFDRSVLHQCLELHKIKATIPDFYCTLKYSRKQIPELEDYTLITVCDHFNIELDHHEALSDARAAAKIALQLSLLGTTKI